MSTHKTTDILKKQVSLGAVCVGLCVIALAVWMWHLFLETPAAVSSSSAGLGLTEYVESVRKDLERVEADRIKNGDPALFIVKDFDLDLNVVVKMSEKGTGKLESEVVTAGMEKALSRELTQKITLHMALAGPQNLDIPAAPTPLSTDDNTERLPTVYRKEKKQ
jgi:biopolymer transport protein ExbB/TolQ